MAKDTRTMCMLVTDDNRESKEAVELLTANNIRFREVRDGEAPEYARRGTPRLYSADGMMPDIEAIKMWVARYVRGETREQRLLRESDATA